MQLIDIILLVIIAIPALAGVFYGFLNILFSLMAWAVASGVAVKFTSSFAPMLAPYIETTSIRTALAFIALFIVSLMIFSTLGYFIVKLLGRSGLTATDRMLGFLFGIGLGGAIVTLAVFFAGFTAFPQEPWWQDSRLIRPFQTVCVWGQQYLPESMAEHHGYKTSISSSLIN